jgi:hypothetical protein
MKNLSVIAAALLFAVAGLSLNANAADAAGAKGSVKGKVVKSDGSPAAGAEIRLTARAERPAKAAKGDAKPTAAERKAAAPAKGAARESVAQATADAHGEFSLTDVPAGTYTLTARLKGAGAARKNVTVGGANAADVTLTLKERAAAKKPGKQAARAHAKPERAQAKASRRQPATQS